MRFRTTFTTACRKISRLIVGVGLVTIAASAIAQGYQYGDRGPYNYYTVDPQERLLLGSVEGHHLGKLREKIRHHDPFIAFNECDFILGKFPNHPEALFICVDQSVLRARKPEIGQRYLDRALQLFPEVASTEVIYGMYLHRLGKYKDAVEKYQRALALDPTSRNAHYNIGLTYLALKEYDLANKHAQEAYALGHPSPGLRDGLKRAGKWTPAPAAPQAAAPPAPAAAEKPEPAPAPAEDAAKK